MNWLSLFDGMSCGRIAAERCGLKVTKYFAAEIKKHAIDVTKSNYPDTIHIGDVTNVIYEDGYLYTENGTYKTPVDIVIGGSPCQDLSSMNRTQKGLKGSKSRLFWEYVRILKETNAKYFFFENVASAPSKDLRIMTETLGVPGVRINSSLVSAQMRERIYWTNIPGTGLDLFGYPCIEQPEDKHIYLKDIIETGYVEREKALAILQSESRPLADPEKMYKRYKVHGMINLVFDDPAFDYKKGIRYLNQTELEKLQTVPEGYTNSLTKNQAADVLGDGWTVDIISHIFNGLKINTNG